MSGGARNMVRMRALFAKLCRLPTPPGGSGDDLEPYQQQFTKWEIAFMIACIEEATGMEVKDGH